MSHHPAPPGSQTERWPSRPVYPATAHVGFLLAWPDLHRLPFDDRRDHRRPTHGTSLRLCVGAILPHRTRAYYLLYTSHTKCQERLGRFGAGGRSRTINPPLTRRMLFRLSYASGLRRILPGGLSIGSSTIPASSVDSSFMVCLLSTLNQNPQTSWLVIFLFPHEGRGFLPVTFLFPLISSWRAI